MNIIHSWVAPNKFNEEYTRLIGTKGGIDFNTGTFSYRPDQKKTDRPFGGGELQQHAAVALQAFVRSVRTGPSRFARSKTAQRRADMPPGACGRRESDDRHDGAIEHLEQFDGGRERRLPRHSAA